jgi:uncharacterized protein YyaL (SSP411 family)
MSNRLAQETSPYLLQHKENPVDWYPWGDEAIERARREDKPIFLSVGYSACHWCHVMEHESFENEAIATLLNEYFVSIKVDREERPDVDQIYMNAVQMLSGRGGWPMSVFLTPALEPFYAGTYWPPHASRGMPGFDQVVRAVGQGWRNNREQVLAGAEQITKQLQGIGLGPPLDSLGDLREELSHELVAAAVSQLGRAFDATWGGFGGAPKFPHPMDLKLLLRQWHRTRRDHLVHMVRTTLDRMASGGIYDHLGGGFARYSVDERWLVPHFEKMLYDNALLTSVYVEAFQVTGERLYEQVVRETIEYVLRDMTDPGGGFYSAEDADSEGEEGRFYTWTPEEIRAVLGAERAADFCRVYDVSDEGNFEGRNILNLPKTLAQSAMILGRDEDELRVELAQCRREVFAARETRVRPGRDDKVLVSWNALMIEALALAGAAFANDSYTQAATKAANFLLDHVRGEDGRLLHTWKAGQAKLDAYLDDYTHLINALVTLYEATFDETLIDAAVELCGFLLGDFSDAEGGGFFYTRAGQQHLIARTKDYTDASVPSGNGTAAMALLRLGKLTGRAELLDAATNTLLAGARLMQRMPAATGQMLLALDFYLGPTHELVLLNGAGSVLAPLRQRFLPHKVLAGRDAAKSQHHSPQLESLYAGKRAPEKDPVLYACRDHACEEPLIGAGAIQARLEQFSEQSG